jgi:hypothetical protein
MESSETFSQTIIWNSVEFLSQLIEDGFIVLPNSANNGPISVGKQTSGSPFAVWVINRQYEFATATDAAQFAISKLTPSELLEATDRAIAAIAN